MDVRAPPPPPRRVSLGEHLHHGVEVLARDVVVRVRPPHRLEQRILLPLLACHRRHDLLGQDVERVRRDDQPVELALVRRPHQRGTLDQLVARQREQPALGHGGEVVSRSTHALQQRRDRPGRADLAHQVHGAEVLKRISFRAAAGSTTALVGSSGAGKSTLINLVLTFNRPKAGRILVDGRDLATLRLADYRRQLGVVLQDNFLFDGTIAENIAFARPHATREDVEEAARIAHCDEFVRRFEKGYDTVVGERGVKLSGGERQRVSIAGAVLADPRILILDEATSSLDSESEAAIQDGLRTLRRGRTTFVIAHRLSTIRSADQILVMERGEIVERGTHAELLAKHGRYRQLYDKQYRFEQDLFVNPGEDFTPEPEAPVTAPPLTPPARL